MIILNKKLCDTYGQYVGTVALGYDKNTPTEPLLVSGVITDADGCDYMVCWKMWDCKFIKIDDDKMNPCIIARDAENDEKLLGIKKEALC